MGAHAAAAGTVVAVAAAAGTMGGYVAKDGGTEQPVQVAPADPRIDKLETEINRLNHELGLK